MPYLLGLQNNWRNSSIFLLSVRTIQLIFTLLFIFCADLPLWRTVVNLPPTDGHHHNCLCVTFVGSLDSSYSGSVRVVCHSHFLPQSIKYILIKNGCLRLCANLKMKFYNEKQKFAADHFMGSYKYNLSSICFKKAILHIFLSSYRTHCLHASQWVLSSCRFPWQHDTVCSIQDCIGNVGNFCSCGACIMHHAS